MMEKFICINFVNFVNKLFIQQNKYLFKKYSENWWGWQFGLQYKDFIMQSSRIRVEYTWMDHRVYRNKIVPAEHIALVKGKINPKKPILVRVHALNFLTDILGTSSFIDNQIKKSMQMISKKKNGVVVIIREPRSWTLSQRIKSSSENKINSQLRDYGVGAQILIDLGIKNMILISNSKKTIVGLEGYGLKVTNRIPIK